MPMLTIKALRILQYQTFCFAAIFILLFNNLIGQANLLEDNNINNLDLPHLIMVSKEKLNDNLFDVESLLTIGYKWSDEKGNSGFKSKLNWIKAKLHFQRTEIGLGISLLKENLALIPKSKVNSNEIASNHLLLSKFFVVKNEFDSALNHLNEADKYISFNEVLSIELERLNTNGFFHLHKRNYSESRSYYEQALSLAKQDQNFDEIAIQSGNLVKIKTKTGERPEALTMSLESLELDINRLTKAKIYSNIGTLYNFLLDWTQSEKYFVDAIKLKQEIGIKNGISEDLNGLGTSYANLKNYQKAISTLEQSLKIKNEQNIYPGSILGSLGKTYREMGDFEKANFYFDEYIIQAKKYKDWEGLCGVYYNKGYYFYLEGKYELALEQLEKCYDIGLERIPGPFFLMINDMLSIVHGKLGNSIESKFYRDEFEKLNNKFSEIENIKKVGAIEQNKNSKPASLEDISKKADPTSNKSMYLKVFIFIICIIALGILFKYYRGISSKKEVINKPLENDKLDLYFEELFDRLDQNGGKNNLGTAPVKNMPEFLKNQLSDSQGWEAFDTHFAKVHKDFYKNLKLKYPQLTSNDLNMCALLKLNINNKDIAQIMAISYDSVRKSQQRLSKKMNLSEGATLRDYILQF